MAFSPHNSFKESQDFFSSEIPEHLVPVCVAFDIHPQQVLLVTTTPSALGFEEVMLVLTLAVTIPLTPGSTHKSSRT